MNILSNKRPTNNALIKKLMKDPKFKAEYDNLAPEFDLLEKMLKARSESGLSQEAVAQKMATTTSVVGRLETAGGAKHHSPSLRTLARYACAIGCELKIDFVRLKNKTERDARIK